MADLPIDRLQLVDHRRATDIVSAIGPTSAVALTIDGASTVTLACGDATRTLIQDPDVAAKATLVLDGRTFVLVGLGKATDQYTLTFEDKVANDLRQQTTKKVFKGNTWTRAQVAQHLAREASVKLAVDPTHHGKIHEPIERSVHGDSANSWDLSGSDLAGPIHWRRFSDGTQLIMGGDVWLASRYKPLVIAEYTDAVDNIDFKLDEGKRASTATATVDADRWTVPPGAPVQVRDLGPGSGAWLVSDFTRPLRSSRGTVTLTRGTHVLPEPKPAAKKKTKGKSKDDSKDSGT